MTEFDPAKIVRRVRRRLNVSQEGLSRLLNATKGAVQHWERGRNRPDLARLLALRELCPSGPERKDLDGLICQTQSRVAPLPNGFEGLGGRLRGGQKATPAGLSAGGEMVALRRENQRLGRQVSRLQSLLERRTAQIRILEDLARDLQREMTQLRGGNSAGRPV